MSNAIGGHADRIIDAVELRKLVPFSPSYFWRLERAGRRVVEHPEHVARKLGVHSRALERQGSPDGRCGRRSRLLIELRTNDRAVEIDVDKAHLQTPLGPPLWTDASKCMHRYADTS